MTNSTGCRFISDEKVFEIYEKKNKNIEAEARGNS